MKNFIKLLILVIIFLNGSKGFTQDIYLKSKSEKTEIQEDGSYKSRVTLLFKKSTASYFYTIFYDTKLEYISNIQLYVKKGRRLKQQPIKRMYEEEAKLDYITSKKIKFVQIPANTEVRLTYLVSGNELMYFSSLPFFTYENIDTLNYQIKVPKKFELVHNTIHKDSLSFYRIDSTKTEVASTWNIKVAPKKVAPDPLQFFGIYKNMKVPLMRTLVMPASYKEQPTKYINDWYLKRVLSKKGIDNSVKQKIDELTKNVTDPLEIVTILYEYVKNNFKYVAIEIGMGAFIPSPANEVYVNKQGDCKDLSNFLSEVLKYKGIESDIALAATYNHISDCDFPSLSSANHVICVAYVKGEAILLDPTDLIHVQGTPVQSLQDRTILIVNSKGGSFYKVKAFSPHQNEILYQLDLKIATNKTSLEGVFSTNYKGISSNYLKRVLKSEGAKKFNDYGKTFFENVFGNQTISNLEVTNDSKKLHFKGGISVNGKSFDDGLNTYIFIDFLPRLIESDDRETLIEGTYIENPFYKKVRVKVVMNEAVEMFAPITKIYKEKGVSLEVVIKPLSNLEIACNYDFIFNHLFIDKENIIQINEVLKSFKKIINDPIVLKKQKN